jgi:hypothetical protein
MALTPQSDRIFYAEVLNGYWAASRIRNVRVPREGHYYHVRSADDFNTHRRFCVVTTRHAALLARFEHS